MRVPKLSSTTSSPEAGSVGRQRINAPIEAFGGGMAASGLASVGKGVANLGAGVQQFAENRQAAAEKKEADDKRDKAKAEREAERENRILTAANDKKKKSAGNRIVLTYDQRMSAVANRIKNTPQIGIYEATGRADSDNIFPKEHRYFMESSQIRKELLEKVEDPDEREALLQRMERSDIARMNSLNAAQASEDDRYNKETRAAQAAEIPKQMGDASDTLNSENTKEWFGQFSQATSDYAQSLLSDNTPPERAKQIVEDQIKLGADDAIKNRIALIADSQLPAGDGEELKAIVRALPSNMFSDEYKASLNKDIDAAASNRIKTINDEANKAKIKQLDNYADQMFNAKSDLERERINAEFVRQSPGLKANADAIMNSSKVNTPAVVEMELDNALKSSENKESFKEVLLEKLNNGEIGVKTWKKFNSIVDVEMDKRKKTVWNQGLLKLDAIKAGIFKWDDKSLDAGSGELRKTGGFDIKIKGELEEGWNNLRDLAYDPNVTATELKQVQDAIFFKPEAKMMAAEIEDRLYHARMMLNKAAQEPGSQGLMRAGVGEWTDAKKMSNEELDEALREIFKLD